jgi:transcriptional regulator with XRE-family HTH domain
VPAERPDDFVRRVTRRIGEVRRARGITQDEVAEALGTATRAYQRMEAGQNLTLHTLARIAEVLGVRPADLVTDEVERAYRREVARVHGIAERGRERPVKRRAPDRRRVPPRS